MLTSASSVRVPSDNDYDALERLIADRVASAQEPFFHTNAEGLFEAYLAGIPEDVRQHYNCRCCRRFIERYGSLAQLDDAGALKTSMIWGVDVPQFFLPSVVACGNILAKSKVTGVFINGETAWGTPFNTPGAPSKFQGVRWTHLHGVPATVFKSPLKTAFQVEAEKREDYITLHRGLSEIPMEAVVQAVRVLEADVVDRSEKTLGVAKWLLALHQQIADQKGRVRDNLIWLAVAKAPPGWCHIRSTMIATLLQDVVDGLPFDAIKRRWNEKMHPLQYQRPLAPPKDQNIEQANKIMEKLGAEGALARRFARFDEITALWKPREAPQQETKKSGGAFDHLKSSGQTIKEVELPAKNIVWEKFRDTVLSDAVSVEVRLTSGNQPFYGLVTAVNPESPPMLQWDGLEGLPRNQVSWYFWVNGSPASQWGLAAGWAEVDAICLKPCHWQSDKFVHQGPGAFFVLTGARDSRKGFGGYFPETLRAEYHGIRGVIEAHSRTVEFANREEGNANGIALGSGDNSGLLVRVKTATGTANYRLTL